MTNVSIRSLRDPDFNNLDFALSLVNNKNIQKLNINHYLS